MVKIYPVKCALHPHSSEDLTGFILMNYPASSNGVSLGNYLNAPRDGELVRRRRIKPLSASGGLVRLWRIKFQRHYLTGMRPHFL